MLDSALPGVLCSDMLAELKGSPGIEDIRVIVLVKGGTRQRARDLDLSADDTVSRPWDPIEMMARTAFQALAVTEKMEGDTQSFGYGLKIGMAGLLSDFSYIAG